MPDPQRSLRRSHRASVERLRLLVLALHKSREGKRRVWSSGLVLVDLRTVLEKATKLMSELFTAIEYTSRIPVLLRFEPP